MSISPSLLSWPTAAMFAPKITAIALILIITTCVASSSGPRRIQILEQEMIVLKENFTALSELVGQMQLILERLEQEERVQHHHHHYHHRYFVDSNNETIEDVNGTYGEQMLAEHELSFERDLIPQSGEHHHHHHQVHHHHPKHVNDTTSNENENNNGKCNGNHDGNGNFNGNLEDEDDEDVLAKAKCEIRPNRALPSTERQNIRGTVHFRQKAAHLVIIIRIGGFVTTPEHANSDHEQLPNNQNSLHGIHVHEFGDLSNGCESAGAHYNPLGTLHGGPTSEKRHIGDLGNIECDNQGKIHMRIVDSTASLTGIHSIIGKSLVIHENPDDLGLDLNSESSMSNGNSGRRLACCVITKQGD